MSWDFLVATAYLLQKYVMLYYICVFCVLGSFISGAKRDSYRFSRSFSFFDELTHRTRSRHTFTMTTMLQIQRCLVLDARCILLDSEFGGTSLKLRTSSWNFVRKFSKRNFLCFMFFACILVCNKIAWRTIEFVKAVFWIVNVIYFK